MFRPVNIFVAMVLLLDRGVKTVIVCYGAYTLDCSEGWSDRCGLADRCIKPD